MIDLMYTSKPKRSIPSSNAVASRALIMLYKAESHILRATEKQWQVGRQRVAEAPLPRPPGETRKRDGMGDEVQKPVAQNNKSDHRASAANNRTPSGTFGVKGLAAQDPPRSVRIFPSPPSHQDTPIGLRLLAHAPAQWAKGHGVVVAYRTLTLATAMVCISGVPAHGGFARKSGPECPTIQELGSAGGRGDSIASTAAIFFGYQ